MRRRVLAAAITAAAAGVGFLGTKPDSRWYRSLDKPAWEPPNIVFPLVWTPLNGSIWWRGRSSARSAPLPRSRCGRGRPFSD